LERLEEGQRGIEGFFAAGSTKPEVVSPDGKRSRSHSPAVGATEINPSPKKPRLPTLHTGKRKTALESFLARKGEPSTPTPVPNIPLAPIDVLDDDVEVDSKTAITESDGLVDVGTENRVCPKCGKLLTPFDDADGASRASSVKEQRQEHEDYHFALDLQDGDRGGGGGDQPKPNAKVKKKVPKKAEGIKAFFTAKAAKHGQSSEE
jgi:DNA polymerase eta